MRPGLFPVPKSGTKTGSPNRSAESSAERFFLARFNIVLSVRIFGLVFAFEPSAPELRWLTFLIPSVFFLARFKLVFAFEPSAPELRRLTFLIAFLFASLIYSIYVCF